MSTRLRSAVKATPKVPPRTRSYSRSAKRQLNYKDVDANGLTDSHRLQHVSVDGLLDFQDDEEFVTSDEEVLDDKGPLSVAGMDGRFLAMEKHADPAGRRSNFLQGANDAVATGGLPGKGTPAGAGAKNKRVSFMKNLFSSKNKNKHKSVYNSNANPDTRYSYTGNNAPLSPPPGSKQAAAGDSGALAAREHLKAIDAHILRVKAQLEEKSRIKKENELARLQALLNESSGEEEEEGQSDDPNIVYIDGQAYTRVLSDDGKVTSTPKVEKSLGHMTPADLRHVLKARQSEQSESSKKNKSGKKLKNPIISKPNVQLTGSQGELDLLDLFKSAIAHKDSDQGHKLHKSGIHQKASDKVPNPQLWPHTALRGEYLNKNVTFDAMRFDQYVAGEVEIITKRCSSEAEVNMRLELLKSVSYLMKNHSWEAVKTAYCCVITEIENNAIDWESSMLEFNMIIQGSMLKHSEGASAQPQSSSSKGEKGGDSKRDYSQDAWCLEYNKGVCEKKAPHQVTIRGQSVKCEHFCSKCWHTDKVKLEHAASSRDCPHYA